jgi:hypothetical protein
VLVFPPLGPKKPNTLKGKYHSAEGKERRLRKSCQ